MKEKVKAALLFDNPPAIQASNPVAFVWQTFFFLSGRSPGSWIILLTSPSRPLAQGSGVMRRSSPLTVAGQRRIFTGLPDYPRDSGKMFKPAVPSRAPEL